MLTHSSPKVYLCICLSHSTNPDPTPTPTPPTLTPTPKQPVAKMRLQTTGKETMNCYVYINTARLPAST